MSPPPRRALKSCSAAHKKTNCLADVMFDDAIAAAEASDRARAAGSAARPLEGVPFSVKDQINCAGYDSTCGLACRTFRTAQEDAVVVAALQRGGAIAFARTNVSQGLMLPEAANLIWGVTSNPYDVARTW
jgi:Asp-tRNA(Asn)/Glu-tRNA(Gln) amidotransferase A subunit family amidase